ncbi:hypothetical protein BHT24_10380 [Escherichia coli]|nr:hypothetical protein BHT24_10380 [Escherichia coli]
MGAFDNQEITLPACPKCGTKTKKKIAWLKSNKSFTCRCGATINVNSSQLTSEIRMVEDKLKKLFK